MKVNQLFEAIDDRLSGFINIPALAHLLPDITNIPQFDSAVDKLKVGQGGYLTIPEKMQLAQAFIGLLGLDAPNKSRVLTLLSGIKALPHQVAQSTSGTTTGNAGAANKTA